MNAIRYGIAAAALAIAGLAIAPDPAPRPSAPPLVGYGCEGATGPLYAYEEDSFPICERIERGAL